MRPGMASQMVFKKVAAPLAVGTSMQTRYVSSFNTMARLAI